MSGSKKMQFDKVEIREYPVIISNNPACEYGPSVELGWSYSCESPAELNVSDYEQQRQGKRRTTAAHPSKLYLSQVRREATLKEAEYTDQDIKAAIRDKSKARRQRSVSNVLMNPVTKVGNTAQAGRRNKKIKRALRNLKKKKKEGSDLFSDHSTIYQGWWIPLSGDLF